MTRTALRPSLRHTGAGAQTVHRILRSLLAAEFVRQDARTRRYNVGPRGGRAHALPERHRRVRAPADRRHPPRRYGFSEGRLIPGATGLSAAVPTRDGRPYLAVSFSAISSRVPRSRVKPLATDLLATCAQIAKVVG